MEVSMSKTRRGKYTDNRICYISKCKGDMRLYLQEKANSLVLVTLCEGNHFRFIEERYGIFPTHSELSRRYAKNKEIASIRFYAREYFFSKSIIVSFFAGNIIIYY